MFGPMTITIFDASERKRLLGCKTKKFNSRGSTEYLEEKKKGRKRKRTESDLHKKESDTRNQTIENWKMEKYIRQCHCVRSPEWGAFQHQLPLGHYLTEV
jgi:hypothetical protein